MPHPPQLSVQEFSARVKAKYPQYQDMDDLDLANQVVSKYPEYRDAVQFPQAQAALVPAIAAAHAAFADPNSMASRLAHSDVPTVGPHDPSFMERVRDMFRSSIFAYGLRSESSPYVGSRDPDGAVQKILGTPESLVNPNDHPLAHGALQAAGNIATVDNANIIGATAATGGVLGPVAPVASQVLARGTSGYFTYQMGKSLAQKQQAMDQAAAAGDTQQVEHLLGEALVEGPMAGLTAMHAVTGGGTVGSIQKKLIPRDLDTPTTAKSESVAPAPDRRPGVNSATSAVFGGDENTPKFRLAELQKRLRQATSDTEVGRVNSDAPHSSADDVDSEYALPANPNLALLEISQPDKPPVLSEGTADPTKSIRDYQDGFRQYISQTRSPQTAYQYDTVLNRFFKDFPEHAGIEGLSDQGSDRFDKNVLEKFKATRLAENASSSSINSTASVLKAFRSWLLERNEQVPSRNGVPSSSSVTLRDLRNRLSTTQSFKRLSDVIRPQDILEPFPENTEPNPDSPEDAPLTLAGLRSRLLAQAKEPEELLPARNRSPRAAAIALEEISPAKARSIERAKETYKQNHTINSLMEYGKVSQQISELESTLDVARRAQVKGFSRGAMSPEDMQEMSTKLQDLRSDAQYLFKEHARGLTDDETQTLIESIEKPVYKQIGQALQLHRLLKNDVAAKALKQALAEDVSEKGLSMESRSRLREILGDESIGTRLTKGPQGQRTLIYDKLGYTTSPDQSFKYLKYIPKGPKGTEIMERVEHARNVARATLETETDPKKRAILENMLEAYPRDFIHGGTLIARKGEYKRHPILVNLKVKGVPSMSDSEFFHAQIPGEIQEINLKNLAAILGKETFKGKMGELTPEQRNLLQETSPEMRRQFKAEFARQRVERLRDSFIENAKGKLGLVRSIKQARGIPADHLTPLETKVAAAIAVVKGKPNPVSGALNAAQVSKR